MLFSDYINSFNASIFYDFINNFEKTNNEQIVLMDEIDKRVDEQPSILITINPIYKEQIGMGRTICSLFGKITKGERNFSTLNIKGILTLGQKLKDGTIADSKDFDNMCGRIERYYYKTVGIPFMNFSVNPPVLIGTKIKIRRSVTTTAMYFIENTYSKVFQINTLLEHLINF